MGCCCLSVWQELPNYRVDEILPSNSMQNCLRGKKKKSNWHVYNEENEEQRFLEEFIQIRLTYYVPRKE